MGMVYNRQATGEGETFMDRNKMWVSCTKCVLRGDIGGILPQGKLRANTWHMSPPL